MGYVRHSIAAITKASVEGLRGIAKEETKPNHLCTHINKPTHSSSALVSADQRLWTLNICCITVHLQSTSTAVAEAVTTTQSQQHSSVHPSIHLSLQRTKKASVRHPNRTNNTIVLSCPLGLSEVSI